MKINSITYRCPVDKQIYIADDPNNGFYVETTQDGRYPYLIATVWDCPCGAEEHTNLRSDLGN